MYHDFTYGFFCLLGAGLGTLWLIMQYFRDKSTIRELQREVRILEKSHAENPIQEYYAPMIQATNDIGPVCPGGTCPLKENCHRYRPVIDVKKEPNLPWPPFKIINGTAACERQRKIDILEDVKRIVNGNS